MNMEDLQKVGNTISPDDHDPEQDKALTKDERVNEVTDFSKFSQ